MAKLLLIDANSFIHRAFHALPPFEGPNNRPTGALYGLTNTLLKVLRDEKPDYIAAAFDTPEKTFRKKMYKEYKAHRPKAPKELVSQIIEAESLFKNLGIPVIKSSGFEADDIIGTLANKFKNEAGLRVAILTGDLDILQLVDEENVYALIPKRGVSNMIIYNKDAVVNRYDVEPSQLVDYKGLVGDPSDNIPGVMGIGPKTAAELLQRYGNTNEALQDIKRKKDLDRVEKKMVDNEDVINLSKQLAAIKTDVPLNHSLESLKYRGLGDGLKEYFEKLGFNTLISRLDGLHNNKNAPTSIAAITNEKVLIVPDIEFALDRSDNLGSEELKIAFGWKHLIKALWERGRIVKDPIYDVKIALWLLDPDENPLSTENLQKDFLYSRDKLKEHGLEHVFYNIEMPLIRVLANMERCGVGVDRKKLKKLKKENNEKLVRLTDSIYKSVGKEFNINSPRQVGQILFDKLGINSANESGKAKKTRTGQYKTSEDILVGLKNAHPVIDLILDHRRTSKAQNTYILPLLELSSEDGRVHTTFLQTSTATGRLASENPNIQNIPKSTDPEGKIRGAFVAKKDFSFLSFDYSQLELRLLAHISKDPALVKAFKKKRDIHALTASYVFDVPENKVAPNQRNVAKTLNFGIIYGMGPKAFSKQSGLSIKEAKDFIRKHGRDFPKVREWQDSVVDRARTDGYITNINGRRRWIRHAGMERAAINMPIQSLNADIIKTAMIKISNFLEKEGLAENNGCLLLSIHDELLLEISDDKIHNVTPKIKEILEEGSASLSVPLVVETKTGKSWGKMKNYVR